MSDDDKLLLLNSHEGNLVEVTNLLENANIESKDVSGNTPLNLAALGGHLDIVKLLIEKSADIESQNIDGETPLHTALHHNSFDRKLDIVKFLIENKANVNSTIKVGVDTYLHTAIDSGSLETVKLLIAKGINLYAIGDFGETPIKKAMENFEFDTGPAIVNAIISARLLSLTDVISYTTCPDNYKGERKANVFTLDEWNEDDRFVALSDNACYSILELVDIHKHKKKYKDSPVTHIPFKPEDFILIKKIIGADSTGADSMVADNMGADDDDDLSDLGGYDNENYGDENYGDFDYSNGYDSSDDVDNNRSQGGNIKSRKPKKTKTKTKRKNITKNKTKTKRKIKNKTKTKRKNKTKRRNKSIRK